MSPQSLQMFVALALGFATAGLLCSAYRLATSRLPSFNLLSRGPSLGAFAAVALLMLAAPFLIMRNTLHDSRVNGGQFSFVFLATVLAGFWSLMSGLGIVMMLQAIGAFVA